MRFEFLSAILEWNVCTRSRTKKNLYLQSLSSLVNSLKSFLMYWKILEGL